MKAKKAVVYGTVVALFFGAVAGKLIHELNQDHVNELLGCFDTLPAPVAWTCKQVLVHKLLQPETIAVLNTHGAALYPMLLSNETTGREMLQLLVKGGVDINATESDTGTGWTALHITAMDTLLWPVKTLLESGADPNARDSLGMTPLDRAREVQAKYPDSDRRRIIELLEMNGIAR